MTRPEFQPYLGNTVIARLLLQGTNG